MTLDPLQHEDLSADDTVEYIRVPVRAVEEKRLMLVPTEWAKELMRGLMKHEEGTPLAANARPGEHFLVNAVNAPSAPTYGAVSLEVRREAMKIRLLKVIGITGNPVDLSKFHEGSPTKPEVALVTKPHEAVSDEELKKAKLKDIASLIRRDVLDNPWLYFVVRTMLSTTKKWDASKDVEGHLPMMGSVLAELVTPVIRATALNANHEKHDAARALLGSWAEGNFLASVWAKTLLAEAVKNTD